MHFATGSSGELETSLSWDEGSSVTHSEEDEFLIFTDNHQGITIRTDRNGANFVFSPLFLSFSSSVFPTTGRIFIPKVSAFFRSICEKLYTSNNIVSYHAFA